MTNNFQFPLTFITQAFAAKEQHSFLSRFDKHSFDADTNMSMLEKQIDPLDVYYLTGLTGWFTNFTTSCRESLLLRMERGR